MDDLQWKLHIFRFGTIKIIPPKIINCNFFTRIWSVHISAGWWSHRVNKVTKTLGSQQVAYNKMPNDLESSTMAWIDSNYVSVVVVFHDPGEERSGLLGKASIIMHTPWWAMQQILWELFWEEALSTFGKPFLFTICTLQNSGNAVSCCSFSFKNTPSILSVPNAVFWQSPGTFSP